MRDFLAIGRRLGQADILFWTLPWLMILIVLGTIAQKTMGLYTAQHTFFASFVFTYGWVPLPGGYTVLTVMTINLICKFLFLSPWTTAKIGIHLIHFAVILLLLGGALTAATMQEGYMALKEGESSMTIRDYHDRVLTFKKNDEKILVDFDALQSSDFFALPFAIKILKTCRNTGIVPRADLGQEDNDGIGAASMAAIQCMPVSPENERNVAGISYRVTGAMNEAENGTYIAFEGRQTEDEIDGYTVRLDRAERTLPFSVSLQRFRRDVYPGTNMPREYESRVTITDGDVKWPAIIAMNEPLRYGGYTFYQSSTAVDQDGQPVSILSVVTNQGWVFPYISGILLAIGLLYHVIWRTRR